MAITSLFAGIAKTTIAKAVKGIFTLGLNDKLKGIVATSHEFGKHAEVDCSIIMRHIWLARLDIVNLQEVTTEDMIALTDKLHLEGSKVDPHAVDQADPDFEIERQELLSQATLWCAALERVWESRAEAARKDLEKAGNKTADGSRTRFNLSKQPGQEFRGELQTWVEWLKDRRLQLKTRSIGGRYHAKLLAAEEQAFPHPDVEQANHMVFSVMTNDECTTTSEKAWVSIIERAARLGESVALFERQQAHYNALATPTDADKALFAEQSDEYREAVRNGSYWVDQVGLQTKFVIMSIVGCPSILTENTYWRTEEAKIRAEEARAKAQEANALRMEAEAETLEITSNTELVKSSRAVQQARNLREVAQAEFDALFAPKTQTKVEDEIVVTPASTEAKKPKSLMPNIISSTNRKPGRVTAN